MAKNKREANLYVICESGFEYNDEIYHRPESEGGKPVFASADRDVAEAKCEDMNFKFFLKEFGELRSYFYDVDEQFTDKGIELLKKHKVVTVDGMYKSRETLQWNENARFQDIPMDDLKEIYKGCKLVFYEVYPCDQV